MTNKPEQLTDLRALILCEIGDFFAGFGNPGELETPEDMQRELTMRVGRILNDHIVNYQRCEALVEILRECRIARDEAQSELQERRKTEAVPVALRWRWDDSEAQWTYALASKMPEFVAAGFTQKNGVKIEYLYTAPPAPVLVFPATLPCAVELKPGLIIGKGCKTETLLTALQRRADYYAEIDAMTPEERAEHDANIAAFKAMLPQPDIEMLSSALRNAPLAPSDSQGRPRAPVVPCPFPCGWDNLNKYAIQDAAFVAQGLVEGEVVTESHRQAVIANNDRLLKVIAACRAAMLNGGK